MDSPASDGFREGVRQGNALDHLSAIGMHFRLFIVALVGRSSRPIGDGSAKGPRSAPVGILVPTGSLKESWDWYGEINRGQSSLQPALRALYNHLYHSRCNHLFALQLRAHVTQGQHPK